MNPLPVFRQIFSVALCATAILWPGLPAARAAEPKLALKDNDVWVMAGDSITAQRLHTNYIEAFFRTRHPELHLHFRNSGISGNTVAAVLSRFDDDVAVFKPTIVSVELGMNDANGGKPPDAYIKGMKELIARIRALPAQPVLISSSPVDDGSLPGDWKGARCQNIDAYTNALKKLAEEENVVVVDQYHPLLELWGQNRRKGAEAAAKNGATPAASATPGPDGKLPPAQPAPMPALIPLGGDSIHTGPVGQYTMAATILAGLKAGGEVSAATVSATGRVAEARRCQITGVEAAPGKLSFTRLDEAGLWPMPPNTERALALVPDAPELSLYLMRVTGLPAGEYRIGVNGEPAGTRTAAELDAGCNLAALDGGIFAERAKTLYALIAKLENDFNRVWRESNADALKISKTLETMDAARGTDAEKFAALLRTFNAEKPADAARKLEPRQVNEPQKLGAALVAIKNGQAPDAEKLATAKAALQASKTAEAEKLAPAWKGMEDAEAQIQAAVQPVALRFEIEKQ